MNLSGRVVLITGATGGLGSVVVPAFRAAGATVIPLSLSVGDNGIVADLTTDAGARDAVRRALAMHGRIDALANLMGGFAGGKTIAETDDETWHSMLDINLNAAFYIARAALPAVTHFGHGRIVMVASRTAVEPAAGLGAYNVAKAGLIALVRTIAAEMKDKGGTANVILPSIIDTPTNRAAMPNAKYDRWVRRESIANLLLWLVSDESADVTGAAIPIYGRN